MSEFSANYYEHRAKAERRMASNAKSVAARIAHAQMAARYETLSALCAQPPILAVTDGEA